MSHDSSRKQFLAKVLGLAAMGAVAPGGLAQVQVSSNKADGRSVAFRLHPQPRAVARRGGAS